MVGEDLDLFFFLARSLPFARELADVFEKNEKKNKTTSVYSQEVVCVVSPVSF